MQQNGAQAFVRGLHKMGIARLYGIIGTSIVGFFDGLYEMRDKIRYISCRHEQVAVSMADTDGRLLKIPGVAIVHSGPGALNSLVSVGNAYKDCSPLILITGAVKSRLKGTDGMLEADHLQLFAPLVKGAYRVERTADIPRILSQAYKASMAAARGPVLIEVPENIWRETSEIRDEDFDFTLPVPISPPKKDLEDILNALQNTSRPLLLAGCGVAYAGASDTLKALVERLQILVITTGNGRGVFPEDHPLSLGRVGFGGGSLVADKAFEKADCLLGLGCGVSDMVTYEFSQTTDADVYLINFDPEADKKKVYVEKNIQADAGLALSELLTIVEERKMSPLKSWQDDLQEERSVWETMLRQSQETTTPLSPSYVLNRLKPLLPRDTIVSGGAGMHVVYANDFLPAYGPQQFLAAVNFGAMGYGLPAALSAKLCFPERTIVAVLGDGEFMMTVQDLETAVREKIGVKIIVINDNSYRVLEMKQKLQYQGHVLGTRHNNPDFMVLAQAFGLEGERIRSSTEVETALNRMMKASGPFLLEIVTDPDDLPPTNLEAALKMGQV